MLIRTPRDAELVAAAWMRTHGFGDAQVTGLGADGGIDVVADRAVAQVKAKMAKTPRSEIQQLRGVAVVQDAQALFFSLGGYTPGALEWAEHAGVALFTFNLQSEVEPVNGLATAMARAADADAQAARATDEILRRLSKLWRPSMTDPAG